MDPRVHTLLSFSKTIRPRNLFLVLVNEVATLVEESPFAFALAAVLDRGTRSEIIWTIPYYLQQRLGDLDLVRLSRMSIENLQETFHRLPAKPRYITDSPLTVKALAEIVVRDYGAM